MIKENQRMLNAFLVAVDMVCAAASMLLASLFHASALIMQVFYIVNMIPLNGYTS